LLAGFKQAFALTGDITATDPVCAKSPQHHLTKAARLEAEQSPKPPESLIARNKKNAA